MESNGHLYLTNNENTLFDPNYRYQIQPIEIHSATKKGTRITVLSNLNKFSNDLQFDKIALLSILAKKLSCRSGFDKTTKDGYLVGEYTPAQIKSILYCFIQKYLLCAQCGTPESAIKCVEKASGNKIKQKCKACGNKCYLENVDKDVITVLKKISTTP